MKRPGTIVNKIAKHIRHEITFSNFQSGQHIKESDISKKFNVSRVPVREAFRLLQSEGYIDLINNRGCFVKTIAYDYVMETGVFYEIFAPILLEKAIPKYTDRTYKKAEAILAKIENCKEFTKVGHHLWDYSRVIYGPSKMKFILGLFDEIYSHGIRSLNNITVIKHKKFYDTTPHRKFLDLCKQNKTEEAIKKWQKHLLNVKKITLSNATK